jgi:methyltransferase (TIGR00027 family)
MREGQMSATALLMAVNRAFAQRHGHIRGFDDPISGLFLPGPLRLLVEAAPWAGLLHRALAPFTLGALDMIALRTAAIDEAIRTFLQTRQVVLVGAGLDTRAWRMGELSGATVFEVDHPETQAYKRQGIARMTPPATVRFVGVDFERDDLDEALDNAGHDPGLPTFWLWEGVIAYLGQTAVCSTLGALTRRSAPASVLAATYVAPGGGLGRWLSDQSVRWMGEPFRSRYTPGALTALLTGFGWETVEDSGGDDWEHRHARPRLLDGPLLSTERLRVARRSP